jgi:hypothetical protein
LKESFHLKNPSNLSKRWGAPQSSDWDYENEWRILGKKQAGEQELTSDREFQACELAAVYFGCRTPQASKDKLIAAVSNWETPISFFQMQDERTRFKLVGKRITPVT